MKLSKLIFSSLLMAAVIIFSAGAVNAQDVDEIIDNYFENTGGKEAWGALKGVKMIAKVNQGGMEIPFEIVQLTDGRQYNKIEFQGNVIMQGVFDGTTLWNTNFQTMKAEKADAETTEIIKLNSNDFPDPLYNYKEKGYTLEFEGTETIEGTETYKLKLTKEPITVDGAEVADITFYYFDTENFVPIVQESEIKTGPGKGMISQATFSDFDEVDGLYFPFSLTQGVKGQPGQPITIESIELNPEVDDNMFSFPEEGDGEND